MHMDLFALEDLHGLIKKEAEWCVSLYMPTHSVTSRVQEDQIRFKNLVREAEKRLAEISDVDAALFLEPAHKLLEDSPFWQHQSDGLALFVSQDLFRPYRLPMPFNELIVVADRFHIKPLIPLLSGDGHFYVLALSQNAVRLLQCTRNRVSEVALHGVPKSLDEALKYDEPEKQLQFHTGSPGGTGKRAALFHGHGVGSDDAKDRILRFFQEVDRGLKRILADERAPMVVAGVDYLLPIFRQATTYPHLLEQTISGNPEGSDPKELHERGWQIVAPYFKLELEDRLAMYRELSGTGKTTVSLPDIVKAAFHGRVDAAFVSLGVQSWGQFDETTNEVRETGEGQPGDMDLIDFAAAQTLINGGVVYALEPDQMPAGTEAAAILRY